MLAFQHEHESIEYPGYNCSYFKFETPGDYREDCRSIREQYEQEGKEVLHVLACFNTGIDWWSGKRVKEDEHGFDVIWRLK